MSKKSRSLLFVNIAEPLCILFVHSFSLVTLWNIPFLSVASLHQRSSFICVKFHCPGSFVYSAVPSGFRVLCSTLPYEGSVFCAVPSPGIVLYAVPNQIMCSVMSVYRYCVLCCPPVVCSVLSLPLYQPQCNLCCPDAVCSVLCLTGPYSVISLPRNSVLLTPFQVVFSWVPSKVVCCILSQPAQRINLIMC